MEWLLFITGAGIFVLDSYYSSNQPVANNSAIVWKSSSYYNKVNLYCISNSSSSSVSAYLQYPYGNPFNSRRCGIGCYRWYSTESYLRSSNQGIFTCRIQDSRGIYLDLHFGMYPFEFNCKLIFLFAISSSMIMCWSELWLLVYRNSQNSDIKFISLVKILFFGPHIN